MMPGTIYLGSMTGNAITANWVTLIIFTEVSRCAMKTLNTQEMIVLLYIAGAMSLGGPFMDLIFRQYLANSDTIRDLGLVDGCRAGTFPCRPAPPSPGATSSISTG